MIKVYEATERLFNHNGLKILHPSKAEVFIEDNGDYTLTIESSISDLEYLQEGMIIRVNTRWGEQGFRLSNPQNKNNKINVVGRHLWKDSSKYVIADSYVDSKGCNDALDHLNNACDVVTPFNVISDITRINSARVVPEFNGVLSYFNNNSCTSLFAPTFVCSSRSISVRIISFLSKRY